MLYTLTLAAHNITRWVVLVLAIYALYRVFAGLFGKKEWSEADRKALSFYAISMDVQLLLGLLLYFVLGNWFNMMTSGMGNVMSNSSLRFFAVEHFSVMLIAVILAHVASIMAKRGSTDRAKFRNGAIFLTLSVLAVLVAIPWASRPLLPVFASLLSFFG
jgi:nitrogen fixation/metabolism regulation signal transduction histidine kinase